MLRIKYLGFDVSISSFGVLKVRNSSQNTLPLGLNFMERISSVDRHLLLCFVQLINHCRVSDSTIVTAESESRRRCSSSEWCGQRNDAEFR